MIIFVSNFLYELNMIVSKKINSYDSVSTKIVITDLRQNNFHLQLIGTKSIMIT